ncbi:hypothetical protein GCM10008927_05140 [Amylibacter ulvae]|uniref:Nitrogen fixation protein FixH n=1 Tax=Paramylibacter ulvae TaxID=1651968 RepID=A0ABQ3CTM7_9RHOB|nr:FixH family protein [Amylibacter ulvae]GHA43433.1 hypothetical protein GCM10008927_05140 [Amylibacter ulvae]
MNMIAKRPLTGRKVSLMFLGAFCTIVSANVALIYSAVGSFPGLETRKPYVEAQHFETRRIAQEALNWDSNVEYSNGQIILHLTSAGNTVVLPNVAVRVGRATADRFDQTLVLEFDGKSYHAPITLDAGNWQVQIKTTALDGTGFRRIIPLIIRGDHI